AIGLGNADRAHEIADRLRSVPPAADAGQRRHARIVPAADVLLLHKLQQLALAQQRISEVEAIKFDLLRRKYSQLADKPVVERAMVLKLQRAHRVRDLLQ